MKGPLFWTLSSRIGIQFFSLLRTVVLARMLSPYDFGVATSAFIAYQLLDMLTFTGFTTALTAHKGNFKEGYPTLWWSSAARGLILALLLYLLSDPIGHFFKDVNVAHTIRIVSLAFIPYSFVNPVMIVEASRFFKFEKIFIVELGEAATYFIAALIFAQLFRDYRALVLGFLAAACTKLLLSYIVRPYIPPLSYSLKWLKRMFSFGIWVNFTFVINFFLMYMDRTIVGKFAGQSALGYYSNAQRLAFLAPPQISSMLSRVLFPYFVTASEEKASEVFSIYMRTVLFLGSLFFAPMFFWNRGLVSLLLGPGWEYSAEILRPLALAGLLAMVSNTVSPISQGRRLPKLDVMRLSAIPVAFGIMVIFNLKDSVWVAWSLVLGYAVSLPLSFWGTNLSGIPLSSILRPLLPFSMALFISLPFHLISPILPVILIPLFTLSLEILLFKGVGALEILKIEI